MNYKLLTVLAVLAASILAVDAYAAGGEDQIMGIVERVLDLIAKFLDQVFQSMADAVKSVWSPSDSKD